MLDSFRLLVDFGLLVFIWLVQLVIYPSFLFLEGKKLQRWHGLYIKRLTYVAFPLMVGQLTLAIVQFIEDVSLLVIVSLFLIMAIWVITFIYAVPAHGRISKQHKVKDAIHALNRLNWYRTIAWTVCFVLSILQLWTS